MALVRIARLTQPDLAVTARKVGRAQLLTIPYSHYCEAAKFALDMSGVVAFDEVRYPPFAHLLPTLATRLPAGAKRVAVDSSSVAGSATSVPLLALADGTVLRDTWEILAYVSAQRPELGAVRPSFRTLLDQEFGPLSRQSAYGLLLKPQHYAAWSRLITHDTGLLWRVFWRLAGGRLTKMMSGHFHTADEKKVAECEVSLLASFDEVWAAVQQLTPPGAEFIGGATPGLADIAVASLVAAKTLPGEYCGGSFAPHFNSFIDADDGAKARMMASRDTPLGRHCMRVYATARPLH